MSCDFFLVTVGDHTLSEFGAKMQSWPEISACEVDTSIFQSTGRNTMHLLQQRRGARKFTCRIDFEGSPRIWTANISAFSALLSSGAVEIDIGDGYLYNAILLSESTPVVIGEVLATVEYQFRAVRHWPEQTVTVITSGSTDAILLCQSNYPKTDCCIRIPYEVAAPGPITLGALNGVRLVVNGLSWTLPVKPTGNITLDGIRKAYDAGDGINPNVLLWTDFPCLSPGANKISLLEEIADGSGDRLPHYPVSITYSPTFL